MNTRPPFAFALPTAFFAALLPLACSSGDEDHPAALSVASGSSGSTTSGGSGGASTATGGTSTGGGAPQFTPSNEWQRTELTCDNVGLPCGNCNDGTVCYGESLSVCVPRPDPGITWRCSVGTCESDAPYCIFDQCMTLEEASCFCTASPGSTAYGCSLGPTEHLDAQGGTDTCTLLDAPCGTSLPDCCEGALCTAFDAEQPACQQLCEDDTECPSGCCALVGDSATKVCSPATECF